MSSCRLLHFNVVLLGEAAKICNLIFPAENESVRVAGLSPVSEIWVSVWKSVFGERAQNWAVRDTIEDWRSSVQYEAECTARKEAKGSLSQLRIR